MTDKHDKLVEMALKSGAVNHFVQGLPDRYAFSLGELAALKSAILADAAKDVEPTLYRGTKLLSFEVRYFGTKGMAEKLGYTYDPKEFCDASTLAAAQALNAELVARVEVLEKDAQLRHEQLIQRGAAIAARSGT